MVHVPAKFAAPICLALFLAACSAPEPGTRAYLDEQQEVREDRVEDTIDELPDWFLSPPERAGVIHAAGSATSHDVQFAVDKAVLAAKRQLADRVSNQVSSRLTQIVRESGNEDNTELLEESERITVNVVRNVSVAGFNIDETKVIPAGTRYRAYVLLSMFERVLSEQVAQQVGLSPGFRDGAGSANAQQELDRVLYDSGLIIP